MLKKCRQSVAVERLAMTGHRTLKHDVILQGGEKLIIVLSLTFDHAKNEEVDYVGGLDGDCPIPCISLACAH